MTFHDFISLTPAERPPGLHAVYMVDSDYNGNEKQARRDRDAHARILRKQGYFVRSSYYRNSSLGVGPAYVLKAWLQGQPEPWWS